MEENKLARECKICKDTFIIFQTENVSYLPYICNECNIYNPLSSAKRTNQIPTIEGCKNSDASSQEKGEDITSNLISVRNEFAELMIQYDKYDKFDMMKAREQLIKFDECLEKLDKVE